MGGDYYNTKQFFGHTCDNIFIADWVSTESYVDFRTEVVSIPAFAFHNLVDMYFMNHTGLCFNHPLHV